MGTLCETFDLPKNDQEIILAILQRYVPENEVWAFGSRVTGGARKHSDLDLVIISSEKIPLEILGKIKDALSESDLPIRVDILDWQRVSPSFQEVILSQKVIFKGK